MCKDINFNRRKFFESVSMSVVALAVLSFGALSLSGCSAQPNVTAQANVNAQIKRLPDSNGFGSMPCSSCIAPPNLSWQTTIAAKDEKGEPLIMLGTIYQPDGTTPAEGIVLFVYHTDSTGFYNKEDDPYNPRLRGWMKTGKDGKYEFRTIKPAPYPNRTTPAHIHAQIYSSQIPEYAIDEYWFEGDPLITPEEKSKLLTGRGGFNSIIKLTRGADGIWRGVRNIKLDSVQK